MEGYQGRYLGIHGEEKGLIKKPSKSEEIAKDKGGNIEFQKTGKKKNSLHLGRKSGLGEEALLFHSPNTAALRRVSHMSS